MEKKLDSFNKKRVLVTGGLGFIGSNLSRRLLSLGSEVNIIDSFVPDCGGNLFNIRDFQDKVLLERSDMNDEKSMGDLVQGMDYIFNLAGQISHIDSMINPYLDLEINIRGQVSLLEACKKYNRKAKVIYAGTRQVYGRPAYLPVDERHPICPVDVNGINKMAGEWYHLLYYRVYGIRAVILRLTNTYGPRQLIRHDRQGFMGCFIRNIIEEKEIQLYGDGNQKRDLNFVDDAVKAFLLVAQDENTDGEIYNLSGGDPVSLLGLVKLMIEVFGKGSYKLVEFPADKKMIDIGDFYADSSKIKKQIGWQPAIGLEEGLKNTFDYYQKYQSHYL